MKKDTNLRIAIYLLLFSILLIGCKKDKISNIAGASWESNLAVPVCHGELSLNNLIGSSEVASLITVSPVTGEMSLAFENDVATITAKEMIALTDVTETQNFNSTDLGLIPLPAFNAEVTVNQNLLIELPTTGGLEINELKFSEGSMVVNVATTLQHDLTLNLSFLDMSLANVPITRTIDIEYAGASESTGTKTIDLTDVISDLTAGGTEINKLRIDAEIEIDGTNNPIVGDEYVNIEILLSDLDFKNIDGYFGNNLLSSVTDSLALSLFANPISGDFVLTNPELTFIVENSFGLPISLNFGDFKSINMLTNEETVISGLPSSLELNIPSAPGGSATTNLVLNNTNTTNLSSLISADPKLMVYAVAAESNPNGNTGSMNFMDENSAFNISTAISVPIEGYANNVVMTDTVNFSFGQNVSTVEEVTFKLDLTNGFPISAHIHAIFVDENYNPLFSLLNDAGQIIQAGGVDSDGKVNSPTNKVSEVKVEKSKIALLNEVRHILLINTLETTQPEATPVKILSTYGLGFNIGMKVTLNTSL